MIEIRKTHNIKLIQNCWLDLESGGIAPFQTYRMQYQIWKRRFVYRRTKKIRFVYYVVFSDGKPQIILPLAVQNKSLVSLSNINGMRDYDFIYPKTMSVENFSAFFNEFLNEVGVKLVLSNISRNSIINTLIESPYFVGDVSENVFIALPFGDDYEVYYNGLNKHVKQNLRTAYNRMKTDVKQYQFKVYKTNQMNEETFNEVNTVYCDRRKRHFHNNNFLHSIYLKKIDFLTKEYRYNPSSFNAVVRIDDKVAAFMSGFIDYNSRTVFIPRLAIDDSFARYSPGMILLNETAKYICDSNDVDILDLFGTNGDYKHSMGGVEYKKKNIVFNPR